MTRIGDTMTAPDRAELAAEVRALGGRLTSAIADLHGLVVNDCLGTETTALNAAGVASRDWVVPFGSIAVHNGGAGPLTISTAPLAETAPLTGTGVVVIPSGAAAVVNLAGRTLTLYGTAGARVVLSVFTKAQPPAWAMLAVLP